MEINKIKIGGDWLRKNTKKYENLSEPKLLMMKKMGTNHDINKKKEKEVLYKDSMNRGREDWKKMGLKEMSKSPNQK